MILYYSDDVLNHIQQSANIVEIIRERISLNNKGKDFIGICPFHADSNPSLNISTSKQIYKCFSCGAGGDVFKFVTEYDKISFPEAVEKIAQHCGIALPQQNQRNTDANYSKIKKLKKDIKNLNEVASDIFQYCLFHDKQAQSAKEYLIRRKLTAKIIKHFKIGFAPNNINFLHVLFKKKGITTDLLVQAGLCGKKENSQKKDKKTIHLYDFFRGRIMFPIHDEKNNLVGFGGRALNDNTAKYINTAETLLFKKKYTLYGLNYVLNNNRHHKYICIVEGYLDVIACLSTIKIPAVAPLGTSFTSLQISILKRFCEEIILIFDSDTAGKRAAVKACKLLLEKGFNKSTVVMLPEDKDPFSLLIENRQEDLFKKLLHNRQELDDFLLKYFNLHEKLSLSEKQIKYRQLSEVIQNSQSSLMRESIEKKAAHALNVSIEALQQMPEKKRITKPQNMQQVGQNSTETKNSIQEKNERDFVVLLALYPHYIELAAGLISPEDITDKMAQWIYKTLLYNKIEIIRETKKNESESIPKEQISFNAILKYFDNHAVEDFLNQKMSEQMKIKMAITTNHKEYSIKSVNKEFNDRLYRLKDKVLLKTQQEYKIKIEKLLQSIYTNTNLSPAEKINQEKKLAQLQSEHQTIIKNRDNIKKNYS